MTTSVMDHHGEAAIQNPILRGFNPDPSITRVGDDYYVATSTFEWYPGVQIHHSRDLRNWRLLTRPLRRASQLDMRGDPDSCGVWAPCLRHYDGLFYLIYTDVKRYGRPSAGAAVGTSLRDMHNYLVTSPTIDGEWSDPVHVNSSGFDPSLFRDDDGRQAKSAVTIPRPGRSRSGARQAGRSRTRTPSRWSTALSGTTSQASGRMRWCASIQSPKGSRAGRSHRAASMQVSFGTCARPVTATC
jgi:Glycosyl hydrolases family 43